MLEAAELDHKNWTKHQGGKTNQGPAVQKSMMIHTLRKEASALCSEAVQGASRTTCIIYRIYIICIKHIKCIIIYFVLYSRYRGRRSWIWIWRMENMQLSNLKLRNFTGGQKRVNFAICLHRFTQFAHGKLFLLFFKLCVNFVQKIFWALQTLCKLFLCFSNFV